MTHDPCFHPLAEFLPTSNVSVAEAPTYLYEGCSPQSGQWLRLPRTRHAEAIAYSLLAKLRQELPYPTEGKMFGVLLVETQTGERGVLKAFSGLLEGDASRPGWVPMIPGRALVAWEETQTLEKLADLKQQLIQLWEIPARSEMTALQQEYEQQRSALLAQHRENKVARKQQRRQWQQTLQGEELEQALALLNWQSQEDKRARRQLTRDFEAKLAPLRAEVDRADEEIRRRKQERKQLSQALQERMHSVYSLTNFAGVEMSLRDLLPNTGIPTGTGECCAPKLLHYAATHQLKPLAMAEFWWGPSPADGSRQEGQFYGACQERCQPIMGFLLSGSTTTASLTPADPSLHIVYEDEVILVVDKPSGLLSVPGRTLEQQDSVVSRVRNLYPGIQGPIAVHRLDQDTSGLLLLAKDPHTHKQLSLQFQQRSVGKQYEALLDGVILHTQGTIQLPLWGDPEHRPYQTVDALRGKPSETHFQVLAHTETTTRVRFTPITGRTHQLRVHAAHPQGLNAPILGDPLYGSRNGAERLCLHACLLVFCHPRSGEEVRLQSEVPF